MFTAKRESLVKTTTRSDSEATFSLLATDKLFEGVQLSLMIFSVYSVSGTFSFSNHFLGSRLLRRIFKENVMTANQATSSFEVARDINSIESL